MPTPPPSRHGARLVRICTALASVLLLALTAAPAAHGAPVSPSWVRQQQWWLDVLGADKAWTHSKGAGVVVAVVDSGVDPTGDLAGAVLPGFAIDGGRGDSDLDKQNHHGTMVATYIAGRGTGQGVLGMAPAAKILPVRIPTEGQAEYTAQVLDKLAAMPDPPEVVNMSYAETNDCTPEDEAAIKKATDKGMILVAGMGNEHSSVDYARRPADCPGVIAVGAYGYFGNLSDGPDLRMWDGSEQQPYATFAAPGEHLVGFNGASTEPRYWDGTSFATAVASGSFALIRGALPKDSSREIVTRAIATAVPVTGDDTKRSEAWGFGVLRPRHAIEDSVSPNAPNPVYDALAKGSTSSTDSPASDSPTANSPASSGTVSAPTSGSPSTTAVAQSDGGDNGSSVGLYVGIAAAAVVLVGLGAFAVGRRGRRA